MNALILHPTIAQQLEHIRELEGELAGIFDQYIHLTFDVIPALQYRYTELFGELERQLEASTLEARQKKRTVQLFALKLDRGEKLDSRMVELVMKVVRGEFAEVTQRVNRLSNIGERRSGETLRTQLREQQDDVRKLYRKLSWRLHPDVNRAGDDTAARYWDLVQEARAKGDVTLLRTLDRIVEAIEPEAERLRREPADREKQLRGLLQIESRRVNALLEREPYTIKENLDHEAWIAEKRASLENEQEELREEIAKADRFLKPIFESAGTGGAIEKPAEFWADWVESMYLGGR